MKKRKLKLTKGSRKGCRGCGKSQSHESMIGKTFEIKKAA